MSAIREVLLRFRYAASRDDLRVLAEAETELAAKNARIEELEAALRIIKAQTMPNTFAYRMADDALKGDES